MEERPPDKKKPLQYTQYALRPCKYACVSIHTHTDTHTHAHTCKYIHTYNRYLMLSSRNNNYNKS